MSMRPLAEPKDVISNGDMSSTLNSLPTVLRNLTMASYTYSWTGSSPTGAISLQISNNYKLNGDGSPSSGTVWVPAYWFDPASGTYVNSKAISGNSGSGGLEIETGAFSIRTVYTPSGGTGSMTVTFVGKVF